MKKLPHERKTESHGMSLSPEHRTWRRMRLRCESPTNGSYGRYGAKGIKVCERWRKFTAFYADMGPRPSSEHSIDRIDSRGNYEPGNCRWADVKTQRQNRSVVRWLQIGDRRLCIADWSRESGISADVIRRRLKFGWSVKDAVFLPMNARVMCPLCGQAFRFISRHSTCKNQEENL